MNSMSSLMGRLMAIIQSHPVCKGAKVVETKAFSPDQFFFKLRAELVGGNNFQVRIYFNQGHIDYAYQLFAHVPFLRWDNKEEFQHIATYPHHLHDEQGKVNPSPLTGDPVKDIEIVLQEVLEFISEKSQ